MLAFVVLCAYAGLVYLLIDTWGEYSMMWAGGNPKSLVIVTLVFAVAQSITVMPIVMLIRHRRDFRLEHINQSHDV